MSGYPPPSGQGYAGYPPQQPGGYPPQQPQPGGYPPQQGAGYPPQQGGYPPAQGGYPPPTNPQSGGFPPAQGGYNPQSSQYPPAQGGYPPPTNPQQGGYPPTNPQQGGYPPTNPQQGGYPPTNPGAQGYPPAQGGYPPQQGGYPQQPPQLQGAPQIWYEQYNSQVSQQNQQVQWAWFSSMDKDRSGEISAAELGQLNLNNRVVGVDLARKLIAVFDKDRSGSISFPEYSALSQFLSILTTEFQKGETKSRSPGYISVNDIGAALQTAGFTLTPGAAINVAKRFDTQRRGVLTWEEYLALTAHVGLLRSIFEWSDTDRDGKVTFDFEAFAYATLYL